MKRKNLFIGICFFFLALTAVLLWPGASYDPNQVHPKLRELSTPYQSVATGYYLDGGSIAITVIDRDSRKLELALPVSSKHGRSYPRLFIGAKSIEETNAVEVPFSKDTRRMLISIVEKHRQPTDSSDIALIALRGAPRDYARVLYRGVVRFCQDSMK